MMKKLIKVAVLVLGLASGVSARASIPTFDAGAIAQAVAIVQQMMTLYDTTMGGWNKNHSDNQDMQKTSEEIRGELDSIHKGLSGNRTEVANLASTKPKELVEGNFYDAVTKADANGNYKYGDSNTILQKHGLNEACENMVGSSKIQTTIAVAKTGTAIISKNGAGVASGVVDVISGLTGDKSQAFKRCNNNATRLATNQAILNKINQNIKDKKAEVQKLSDRVSQTKDQKESADLTALIAKTNVEIEMEINQMQLIQKLAENQQRVDSQADMLSKR